MLGRIPITNRSGGLYIFYIKGTVLPFFENYPAYIGRAKNTANQNLRKRCKEYYSEFYKKNTRLKIHRMIDKWGKYLHLRYIQLDNNKLIESLEAELINGILPPFNDRVPIIEFSEPKPAFNR